VTGTREQRGWYFYDWANSAFASTVITAYLGPHLTRLALAASDGRGLVHPFGLDVDARAYWGYMLSLSVAAQVALLPVVGAAADSSHRKKQLLALFAYAGALATAAMYALTGGAYQLGGALFLVANVSFGASIVVYNSFLPEIASAQERDAVSSKGWGLGYLGGGILLALNLALSTFAGALGLTEGQATRINLASAGLWWALFTIIPLRVLRNRRPQLARPPNGASAVTASFRQLGRTLAGMKDYPQTLLFLLAYLLYNDAVQAVIALSGQFAADELKMSMALLALSILMVQFVAFAGSFVFNWLAGRIGAKRSVMLALVVWIACLVAIYGWVRTAAQFFLAAAVIALVLGGTQALSRSLFSLMIPAGREAEYFGLYEISDKGTSWLCPLLFALALQFTHSYRLAILSLITFFVLGLAALARVDVERAARQAAR
jgi:MFS transporter, UMF1 family